MFKTITKTPAMELENEAMELENAAWNAVKLANDFPKHNFDASKEVANRYDAILMLFNDNYKAGMTIEEIVLACTL